MLTEADAGYMARCIELALQGAGSVSPNPMVGSLIVCDGSVIGEGYHMQCGGPHAEVNAIAAVSDPSLLSRSTLYVNLEPCSHFGRTPPCSDLIIEKKIPRVVVGCRDPNPKVAGRGIMRLRDSGVDVYEGVLEAECLRLNEAFITSHTKGRPFVALKIAETLDGRIATADGASKWITGSEARREVHRLRSTYDAVLAGAATVLLDRAQLTVRDVDGPSPLRVVLDSGLRVPFDAPVFSSDAPTLVFAAGRMQGTPEASAAEKKGIEVVFTREVPGGLDLSQVLRELHRRDVLSLLVESGSRLSAAFVRAGLADKLLMFIAPKLFGADALPSFAPLAVEAPSGAVQLEFGQSKAFGRDILLEAYFQS